MKILVLDTAKTTGWSTLTDGVITGSGIARFEEGVTGTGELQRHPQILQNCLAWLNAVVRHGRPDFIVAEIPHLRGASSFLTVAIYGVVQLVSRIHGIGFYGVHTAAWQSKIVPAPKGVKAKKGDTKKRSIAHVLELGFTPATDDEADAICIAEYVRDHLELSAAPAVTP
jgi:hypothetical protein